MHYSHSCLLSRIILPKAERPPRVLKPLVNFYDTMKIKVLVSNKKNRDETFPELLAFERDNFFGFGDSRSIENI